MQNYRLFILVSVLFLACGIARAGVFADNEELLTPAEAFKLEAEFIAANQIEVRYDIAPGYYLYRERFKFTTDTPGVKLGSIQFPAGVVHEDDFFGRVETYRLQLFVNLELEIGTPAPAVISLRVTSQGCADIGVCFPPHEETREVAADATDRSGVSPKPGN
jgi:thiol:disulfide interchange protein DsbD